MHDAASLHLPQAHDPLGTEIGVHGQDRNNNSNSNNNNDSIIVVGNANDLASGTSPDDQIKALEPLLSVASLNGVEWRDYLYECARKGCGLTFASESLLQEHMLAAHEQMMPPEYQGLEFLGFGAGEVRGSDAGRVRRTEQGTDRGTFRTTELFLFDCLNGACPRQCPLCDSTFDSKDLLEEHIDSHQQERGIVECDFCGKDFMSRFELTRHMTIHAQESQSDPQCQLCGKFFATHEDAILHLKVHSPGGRLMKQRKFKCERCDRSFFTRKDVKRHMVVHTGQRNFVCQFCPQKFGRKDHLVRHTKKTHTNGTTGSNNNNNNNNPNATNNNTLAMGVASSNHGSHLPSGVGNRGGQAVVPSPPVPLSDPGVSSTTGLLPSEPAPPQSPLLGPSVSSQQMMTGHPLPHSSAPPGTPGTPVLKVDGSGQPLAFSYSELTSAQIGGGGQFQLDEIAPVPPSAQVVTPLTASTSTIANTHHQLVVNSTPTVTVLPTGTGLGGVNGAAGLNVNLNVSVLQSGKDPLVGHPPWPPTSSAGTTAYLSPSFNPYFVDDENRNAVPLALKGGDPLPSMATLTSLPSSSTNTVTTNAGLPSMSSDFHPSSTSSSYFTLMPIISQNPPVGVGVGGYYTIGGGPGGGGQGGLAPLSPTSPQTTTPLTPPLADGLGSPLPHFSQAFQ
ncbi:zinc finger protein-like [Tropilaelaps mercedesae]|uniref:Zinc finger protein-like n=1 Tax=Tropilaelaps mercedesae TaxID=418985 RepID=A0A1V9X914_9ACAR|nr:zinc finger protein-like [Tropilaelaps mercedesae]